MTAEKMEEARKTAKKLKKALEEELGVSVELSERDGVVEVGVEVDVEEEVKCDKCGKVLEVGQRNPLNPEEILCLDCLKKVLGIGE